jgi:hypothetical protein
MVAVVAHSGNQVAPLTERKVRVLRRKDQLHVKPTQKEIAIANGQDKEERSLEDKIPEHLPIKIKIRADREKEFKDLDNKHWARDLEIEVKNTGTKPIYQLVLLIELPEADINNGKQLFSVRFGRVALSVFKEPIETAKPDDVPIKPGETIVLKIPESQARGWELWRAHNGFREPKKVVVEFEQLSFGDGTGFRQIEGTPWPPPKRSQSNSIRGRSDLPIRTHHSRSKLEPAPDCCPSGCQWVHEYEDSTSCYGTIHSNSNPSDAGCTVHRVDVRPCSESGDCRKVSWENQTCIVYEGDADYEYGCPYAKTSSCGSASPSGGGGGGSGSGGNLGGNPFGCDEYYWIWYVFNGSDWGPLGPIDYAGCW